MRTIRVCALLFLLPAVLRADEPNPTPNETVVRLKIHPQAAPTPALRYQLLPELKEMQAGNPIPAYFVCFMEQNTFFHGKESADLREKWQTAPLKELPGDDILGNRGYSGKFLRQADYAARLDTPDWQLLFKLRRDGVNLLLPDVQQLRMLAGALKVRFRAEVILHRFDDALVTAKTMLALSRHLGEHPSLIGNLVGIAIATMALATVEEMVQEPGCPNLYWALTDLPTPFFDLRKGMQGERALMESEFALIDDKEPMSPNQIDKAYGKVRQFWKDMNIDTKNRTDVAAWVVKRSIDAAEVSAARKRLMEAGHSEEKLKRFPATQIILLDEKREVEMLRDERMKGQALPYWEAAKVQKAADQKRTKELEGRDALLFEWMIPITLKVREASARLDRRIALLRCVEALRMYAAANDGKLPAKLDDAKVPIPLDPMTGKPFPYKLEGDKATLRAPLPEGHAENALLNLRYEITIAK